MTTNNKYNNKKIGFLSSSSSILLLYSTRDTCANSLKDASGNGPWQAIRTTFQNGSTITRKFEIAGSTMKSSKHKSNSVISKTKSTLLEASAVFDGLTFKNDEADIIDVKKTLLRTHVQQLIFFP